MRITKMVVVMVVIFMVMLVIPMMLMVVMTKWSHWNFSHSFKTTCHHECLQKLIMGDD